MLLFLLALALLVISGFAALLIRSPRGCSTTAVGGVVAASVIGLIPAVRALLGAPTQSLHLAWDVPYGAFFIELDALSAFFLLPIFAVSALAAVYGSEYLLAYRDRKALGPPWFFFNVLVASMAVVVTARNGVLFLVAWEVMALASFFLVTFEDEQESVRDAGWIYLIATHLGTAFLLALFVLLGRASGSLDFDHFTATPPQAGLLFLLAVIGFGTKAGCMPLHVWLPEAHPAAPSHVSAVMSGVMIKTGIYGLIRTLTFLGPPPPWWGWLLVTIGLTSGVLGVLLALAQRDLKRVLAYSSVENIGIIVLGLGVCLLGLSAHTPLLAVLGCAGALLHVWNHALFKGLLFLAAGAVAHGTGTRNLEQLGGLLKRMPWTGATFLLAAAAICGLPPLNGFISEWLIYLAAFHGGTTLAAPAAVPALAVIAGLALIGGLAVACFTRAFGIAFLGEPRSDRVARGHEPGRAMRWPMLVLAAGCLAIGLLPALVVPALAPVIEHATGMLPSSVHTGLAFAAGPLVAITMAAFGLLILIALLAALRRQLLVDRQVATGLTWDCGYAAPSPRMQYSASSFAQPLTELFSPLLQTRHRLTSPQGFFPRDAALTTDTPDVCAEHLYRPIFSGLGRGLASLRWLQHGEVHLYVLYIALTLLVLLVWKLG